MSARRLAVLLALASGCGDDGASTPTTPPPKTDAPLDNVLLILLDDVGDDKVGAVGLHPTPPPTPNLDALAAEGVTFRQAFAYSACSPTRAALLTGRYGRRTGVGEVFAYFETPYSLPLQEVLLPELLQLGPVPYESSATGKWHLTSEANPNSLRDPLDQGFGWWAGTIDNLNFSIVPMTADYKNYFYWERIFHEEPEVRTDYATTSTIDDAIDRMGAMRQPWFLYVPLNAAHEPWVPPPESLDPPPLTSLYDPDPVRMDAIVEAADLEIGRLLAAIPEDVRARTTIIVLGDNGTKNTAFEPPLVDAGGKLTLYETGVRVPLIVAGPRVAQPGSTCDALVSVVDVYPTVAWIAGVDTSLLADQAEPGSTYTGALDGQSLKPYLDDPATPSLRQSVLLERFAPDGPPPYRERDFRGVRTADYKLLHDQISGGEELYRVSVDSLEDGPNLLLEELSDEARDNYDRLRAELEAFDAIPYEGTPRLAK